MIRKYHVEFYVSILSKKEINNMHPELAAEFWHYPLNLIFFIHDNAWQCIIPMSYNMYIMLLSRIVLPFLYKKNCVYCIKKIKINTIENMKIKKRNPMTSEKICLTN